MASTKLPALESCIPEPPPRKAATTSILSARVENEVKDQLNQLAEQLDARPSVVLSALITREFNAAFD